MTVAASEDINNEFSRYATTTTGSQAAAVAVASTYDEHAGSWLACGARSPSFRGEELHENNDSNEQAEPVWVRSLVSRVGVCWCCVRKTSQPRASRIVLERAHRFALRQQSNTIHNSTTITRARGSMDGAEPSNLRCDIVLEPGRRMGKRTTKATRAKEEEAR